MTTCSKSLPEQADVTVSPGIHRRYGYSDCLGLESRLFTLQSKPTFWRRVTVDNPRKVGKHYFVPKSVEGDELGKSHAEFSEMSSVKSSNDDMETWDYWVEIGLLVKLRQAK